MLENRIETAIRTMMTTDKMHRRLFDRHLSDIDIHRSAHHLLFCIQKNNGVSSQKELAKMLDITPAAVTVSLKKLEKEGYIKRKIASDNRYNEISVTERGKKLLDETKNKFMAIDRSLFENFTDEEIENYISYMEKMQKNIEKQIMLSEEDK